MILKDSTATAVLEAVFEAAGRAAGSIVRTIDLRQFTSIDPAVVDAAISELINAKLLMLGGTNDLICLSAAGFACIHDHLSSKV